MGEPTPLDGWMHQVERFVRRFVVLNDDQACAVVLWVVHTHAFSSAIATPYIAVSSAEMESGKTRLLEVLRVLVANPWFTGRTTTAALTRKIDKAGGARGGGQQRDGQAQREDAAGNDSALHAPLPPTRTWVVIVCARILGLLVSWPGPGAGY
jgi:hypothetical protein